MLTERRCSASTRQAIRRNVLKLSMASVPVWSIIVRSPTIRCWNFGGEKTLLSKFGVNEVLPPARHGPPTGSRNLASPLLTASREADLPQLRQLTDDGCILGRGRRFCL